MARFGDSDPWNNALTELSSICGPDSEASHQTLDNEEQMSPTRSNPWRNALADLSSICGSDVTRSSVTSDSNAQNSPNPSDSLDNENELLSLPSTSSDNYHPESQETPSSVDEIPSEESEILEQTGL